MKKKFALIVLFAAASLVLGQALARANVGEYDDGREGESIEEDAAYNPYQ